MITCKNGGGDWLGLCFLLHAGLGYLSRINDIFRNKVVIVWTTLLNSVSISSCGLMNNK